METEIMHGPAQITVQNVQYWSKHAKALKQTQVHKAMQFVEYDLIRYVGDDPEFNSKYTFICLPLNTAEFVDVKDENGGIRRFNKKPFPVDYNFSVYKIYKNDQDIFECNCQGWQTRKKREELQDDGVMCSHVLALFFCFKIKRFGRKQGNEEAEE
jgi:hypothetical protein